ncbi:MAG: exodeoxyribonuclease V subunit gamma [Acidobacteria bacterium]|nr:exodeoxyribonuclease V subunit gamma [Acidobacteriota bacterium]
MGVTIVTGLATEQKREYLLSEFAKAAERYDPADILLLAPNFHFIKDIRFGLMQSIESQAIHPPDMYTFINLAEKIVNHSELNIRRIEGKLSRSILQSIIDEARQQGEIPSLGESASVRGFTGYVDNFLYMLKQCEVDPEVYYNRIKDTKSSLRDMLLLYYRYQSFLEENNLYDDSGIFWQAHEILRRTDYPDIVHYKKIFIYGFTSFTYIQKRILAKLISTAKDVVVFLESENIDDRAILFAETKRLEKYFSQFGAGNINFEIESTEDNGIFSYLRQNLFKPVHNEKMVSSIQDQDDITSRIDITAATDYRAEAETIARDVKRLIIRDGYAADDILVAVPDIEDISRVYDSVFNEAGIPFHINHERHLGESSVFIFLEKLLRLAADDFKRADLKNIITSKHFHTLASRDKGFDTINYGEFLLGVDMIIENSTVVSGYSSWKIYLENLISGNDISMNKEIAQAVLDIIKMSGGLVFVDNSEEVVESISKIIYRMEHSLSASKEKRSEELFTLQQCREVAEKDLRILSDLFPSKAKNDLLEMFLYIARNTIFRQSSDSNGRVVITNQYDIRGRRPSILFLAGMNHGLFPIAKNEINFPFKKELITFAPELGDRLPAELPYLEDQMILFFQVISSVQDKIFISYRESGDSERSIYIDDLLELIGPHQERIGLSFNQSPTVDKVLSNKQLTRLLRFSDYNSDITGDLPGLKSETAVALKTDLVTTQEFSDVQRDRENSTPVSNFDGVLHNSDALAIISGLHKDEFQYSASYLESFGKCPFRFFCEKILHVKAKDEKSDELSAMDEGTFYHWVLREFYTSAMDELRNIESPGALDLSLFDEKVDEIIKQWEEKVSEASQVLDTDYWNITLRKYKSNIKRFIRFDLNQLGEFLPLYFELAFGSSAKYNDSSDESLEQPFNLDLEGLKVFIGGKIDRFDLNQSEGSYNVRVIDYKSGNFNAFGDIVKGTSLQLHLYAYIIGTVEQLEMKKPDSVEATYRSIRNLDMPKKYTLLYENDRLIYRNHDYLPVLKKIVEVFVKRIKRGFYPPLRYKGECDYCNFKNVCFFDEERLAARLDKTEIKVR